MKHRYPAPLTVEEAANALGISRNATYDAVRRGEIPAFRVGGRILIPRTAFEELLSVGKRPKTDR